MRRVSICVVVLAAFAAAASPALGRGAGLYEPSTEPAAKDQAWKFIGALRGGRKIERRLTESQFDNGVLLRRAGDRELPRTTGPTARRAGIGSGSELVEGWPLAVAAAAAVLAAAAWLARRRA